MDSYIDFDAPRKLDTFFSPFFAASAAPAAICCFFDCAGILYSRYWLLVLDRFLLFRAMRKNV